MSAATYPARVNARLDQPLSRWLDMGATEGWQEPQDLPGSGTAAS
jgi:hypothetical protein